MELKFGQYFAADVFVEVTKLNLGQDSEPEGRFGQDFKLKFSRDTDVWLRF